MDEVLLRNESVALVRALGVNPEREHGERQDDRQDQAEAESEQHVTPVDIDGGKEERHEDTLHQADDCGGNDHLVGVRVVLLGLEGHEDQQQERAAQQHDGCIAGSDPPGQLDILPNAEVFEPHASQEGQHDGQDVEPVEMDLLHRSILLSREGSRFRAVEVPRH